MTATAPQQKITYTCTNVDWAPFTRRMMTRWRAVRAAAGRSYPLYINGKPVESPGQEPIVDVSPIDTGLVLGRFACATAEHVDQAMKAAKTAQKAVGASGPGRNG